MLLCNRPLSVNTQSSSFLVAKLNDPDIMPDSSSEEDSYSNNYNTTQNFSNFNNFEEMLTELCSLGITAKKLNALNDCKELYDLVDNIKLTLYQDYKTAYSA
jgi:hypothetical protein